MKFSDYLKYSFVISINDIQLKYFNDMFKYTFPGYSAPRPIVGFKGTWPDYHNYTYINGDSHKSLCRHNCMIGHQSIIRMAKSLDYPYVMIFEDDSIFQFYNYNCDDLDKACENIPGDAIGITLGYWCTCSSSGMKVNEWFSGVRRSIGAHAYIVFKSGYDTFISLYNEIDDSDQVWNDMRYFYMTNDNFFIQSNITDMSLSIGNHPGDYTFHDFIKTHDINDIYSLLPYSNNGQFGNQVMYGFLAYVMSKQENKRFVYHALRDYKYEYFNLTKFVRYVKNTKVMKIDNNLYDMYSKYKQHLSGFIKETFLQSEVFQNVNTKLIHDRILFYIRLGDYLNRSLLQKYGVLYYKEYIDKVCKWYKQNYPNLDKIDVLTNSNDIFQKEYEYIIKNHYSNINYIYTNSTTGLYDDIFNASLYKYRAITCSSYGFLCSKIADVLYDNSNVTLQLDIPLVHIEEDTSNLTLIEIHT